MFTLLKTTYLRYKITFYVAKRKVDGDLITESTTFCIYQFSWHSSFNRPDNKSRAGRQLKFVLCLYTVEEIVACRLGWGGAAAHVTGGRWLPETAARWRWSPSQAHPPRGRQHDARHVPRGHREHYPRHPVLSQGWARCVAIIHNFFGSKSWRSFFHYILTITRYFVTVKKNFYATTSYQIQLLM